MSLIVRKEMQGTLDSVGLTDFHVGINSDKYAGTINALQIVGPCGKPLVTLGGIVFSKKTPNETEITYAVKLFRDFVHKYKKEFDNLVTCKIAVDTIPEIPLTGKIDGHNYNISTAHKIRVYIDNSSYFFGLYATGNLEAQIKEKQIPILTSDLKDKAKVLLSQHMTYNDAMNQLTEAKRTLAKCDI